MEETVAKPTCVFEDQLQEILVFLDDLRENGATNMYGAAPYIEAFCAENGIEIQGQDSVHLLKYWMRTFGERHP